MDSDRRKEDHSVQMAIIFDNVKAQIQRALSAGDASRVMGDARLLAKNELELFMSEPAEKSTILVNEGNVEPDDEWLDQLPEPPEPWSYDEPEDPWEYEQPEEVRVAEWVEFAYWRFIDDKAYAVLSNAEAKVLHNHIWYHILYLQLHLVQVNFTWQMDLEEADRGPHTVEFNCSLTSFRKNEDLGNIDFMASSPTAGDDSFKDVKEFVVDFFHAMDFYPLSIKQDGDRTSGTAILFSPYTTDELKARRNRLPSGEFVFSTPVSNDLLRDLWNQLFMYEQTDSDEYLLPIVEAAGKVADVFMGPRVFGHMSLDTRKVAAVKAQKAAEAAATKAAAERNAEATVSDAAKKSDATESAD
ncbi:hypothetical protein [Changpingibacter yushuensis]|uniref:hypothetical protein n=1 Tax=Changpingibacter yushuensis TaxID=2758440 RepID=UPI0015F60E00|nr:hypothetical protein [Changpingibacter yushuensis]